MADTLAENRLESVQFDKVQDKGLDEVLDKVQDKVQDKVEDKVYEEGTEARVK